MRTKTALVFLFSAILTLATCGSSLATIVAWGYPNLELAKPLIGPHTELPPAASAYPYSKSAALKADPLGETYLMGTTWYDYQHNCTISKMIALSPNGGVHVCWMNGLQAQAIDRHIYYNYVTPEGTVNWEDVGYQVDQADRGGYTCLDQFNTGEVVIFMHSNPAPTDPWTATVAWDFLEGFGAFQDFVLWPPAGWANSLAWPHGMVDAQDNIHLVAHEVSSEVWQRIAYTRSEDRGATFTDWAVVDTIVSISGDMASSPVSNKVGLTYCKSEFDVMNLGPYAGYLVSQMNNGIALIESQDGTTWDFTDRQDVTNLVNPDTSRWPDSTWANGDTLRAYCDVSLLYDYNDNAHIAFTTRGFWFDASLYSPPPNSPSDSFAVLGITLDASVIWHWSEEYDTLTVIADGWYDVGDPDAEANEYRGSGAWRSTCDRPSLGLDPETGYLYCTYVRCVEGDTSGGPIPSHGFANGEVYCSVSTDGGLNWSEGTNLTQTSSPQCWPGNCMDEDYASLARVVNDTLHLMYVEDKDAGGIPQEEGTWTENPVKYQKVPANLVPPGPPFVPNFPFHVGPSTGVQEPTLVDGWVPQSYALCQNYPNPFNPQTTIRFDIPQAGPVSLRIYNVTGQLVRELTDGHRQAGRYDIHWDGRDEDGHLLPSGIYFCQMEAGEFVATRKMALIK